MRRPSSAWIHPNRTDFIALLKYTDGTQSYIRAPQRLASATTVISGSYVDVQPGNVSRWETADRHIMHNVN